MSTLANGPTIANVYIYNCKAEKQHVKNRVKQKPLQKFTRKSVITHSIVLRKLTSFTKK